MATNGFDVPLAASNSLRSTRFYNCIHELILSFALFFFSYRNQVDRIVSRQTNVPFYDDRSIRLFFFLFSARSVLRERNDPIESNIAIARMTRKFFIRNFIRTAFTRNMLFYWESFVREITIISLLFRYFHHSSFPFFFHARTIIKANLDMR